MPGFVSPAHAEWSTEVHAEAERRGVRPRDYVRLQPLLREYAERKPPPAATTDDVVRHLEHVRDVAGVDHVGIGGDYDGSAFMPADLPDVSGYPRLFDTLAERGWSEADLAKLAGGNVLRVLQAADD